MAPLIGENGKNAVRMVNAALVLRRPLLVTGQPGSGKSTLARLVARELGLGPVLHWPITSSTQLRAGLYSYDAIGRVHDENRLPEAERKVRRDEREIGRYIRLGPLGTALLPWKRPRVLLIDEIDKSDIDLPNDLLHVFEEGSFTIPELERLPDDHPAVPVMTADRGAKVEIDNGRVECKEFPFVVLTSNEERTFPPAFLRRCLRLELLPHDTSQLAAIVKNRIVGAREVDHLIGEFEEARRTSNSLATDQLLNAVFLVSGQGLLPAKNAGERELVVKALLGDLAE